MRGRRVRMAIGIAALATLVPASVAVANGIVPAPSSSYVIAPTVNVPPDPAGVLHGGPIRGVIASDYLKKPTPAIADLPRLKSLGVNTISAYIYTYMDSVSSDNVHITAQTVSDQQLSLLATTAHQLGMAVEFSPVIVVNGPYIWRGFIKPTNVAAWFHSYNAMITHYVVLANALKVEILSIGSELYSLQGYTANWQHLALWVNLHYPGLTTYMATGNSVFYIPWLGGLDIISLSPYYSLSSWSNPDPPVNQLVYTWQHAYLPRLYSLFAKFHRRLLFSEIGYTSAVGTTVHPAQTFRYDTPESQSAQANAYMALLRVLSISPWIRGAVWWHWDQVKNAVIDRGFSPRDKAAECVIGHYWGPPSTRVGPPVDTTADACLLNHVAQS